MFTAVLFPIAKKRKQPKCPSTDEWIKMWCIYSGLLVIKWSEFGSLVEIWMELDPVIQSEGNQKEKNKYHTLMYIRGNQKNGTDESICRTGIEMQIQKMDIGTHWGRRQWDKLGDQG